MDTTGSQPSIGIGSGVRGWNARGAAQERRADYADRVERPDTERIGTIAHVVMREASAANVSESGNRARLNVDDAV